MGATVVAMSDSNGYVYDPNGIDFATLRQLKEVERKRIKEYADRVNTAEYHEGCRNIWSVPCDIALPCATQNELHEEDAKTLIANGCYAVAGRRQPAQHAGSDQRVCGQWHPLCPGQGSNAGGVACSALEMAQNAARLSWTFEQVDSQLKNIMTNIYKNAATAAKEFGFEGNLVVGANVAGFIKVADAMMAQGLV